MQVFRLEIATAPSIADAHAAEVKQRFEHWLGIVPDGVACHKLFHLELDIGRSDAERILEALTDPISEVGTLGTFGHRVAERPTTLVTIAFRPGVTDTVGASAKRAAEDLLGRRLEGHVYSSMLYAVEGLARDAVEQAAAAVLYNPVIEQARFESPPGAPSLDIPAVGSPHAITLERIAITTADDTRLLALSRERLLSLNLFEMRAIAAHFRRLGREPTDAELECLAQTWSEHCKHKILAAPVTFVDANGRETTIEDGLFRRYIRGTTEAVARSRIERGIDPPDAPFLVSVFHDNAGVVRFTDRDHLAYKVETHNSPSALDPYGGAMTGIVGVNRDSFGTGRGADLLTNVWGYCFGDPQYAGTVPTGLMHPGRIRAGVHRGVVDGGNQSGVPQSRGFELFDDRYMGKPLVFCGTVSVMPVTCAGEPTERKPIRPGDRIVMIGGRVGKDGIHGATFSSAALEEGAPPQVVQIGDPITQKMMFDMLTEARDRGLLRGMTDNGAGGLSSSVGELAETTGGASIDLAKVPLKYAGLDPWEILVSEAQERMTVAVAPESLAAFLELAERREVEASDLGCFTDGGTFEVWFGEQQAVSLELAFLHGGCPRTPLVARESATPASTADSFEVSDLGGALLDLLRTHELRSGEPLGRAYDHEVKGLSVVKPFVGVRRDVPATATVMRVRHGRSEGVVLAEGVHPHYSELDANAMAHACVDEAVRRVLCAGARIDRIAALDNFCWPDPVTSDATPDGARKLAQLVRCCQGLRAACEALGVPLISGKDSMKNDAVIDGVKISIPPTLLVSAMGQLEDVRAALTLVPRAIGDDVYVLGPTAAELGGSALARLHGWAPARVPQTDLTAAPVRYGAFVRARDAGLIRSAHVTGRGGLAVALAHLALACEWVVSCELTDGSLDDVSALFAESTGRIVFTARPRDRRRLRDELGPCGLVHLGVIEGRRSGLLIRRGGQTLIDCDEMQLRAAFHP